MSPVQFRVRPPTKRPAKQGVFAGLPFCQDGARRRSSPLLRHFVPVEDLAYTSPPCGCVSGVELGLVSPGGAQGEHVTRLPASGPRLQALLGRGASRPAVATGGGRPAEALEEGRDQPEREHQAGDLLVGEVLEEAPGEPVGLRPDLAVPGEAFPCGRAERRRTAIHRSGGSPVAASPPWKTRAIRRASRSMEALRARAAFSVWTSAGRGAGFTGLQVGEERRPARSRVPPVGLGLRLQYTAPACFVLHLRSKDVAGQAPRRSWGQGGGLSLGGLALVAECEADSHPCAREFTSG